MAWLPSQEISEMGQGGPVVRTGKGQWIRDFEVDERVNIPV